MAWVLSIEMIEVNEGREATQSVVASGTLLRQGQERFPSMRTSV
jgi:hypothetical protein